MYCQSQMGIRLRGGLLRGGNGTEIKTDKRIPRTGQVKKFPEA